MEEYRPTALPPYLPFVWAMVKLLETLRELALALCGCPSVEAISTGLVGRR